MAEAQLKRQREETQVVAQHEEHVHDEEKVETKRRKSSSSSYNEILSLLDGEEDMPNHDISSLVTTLQEELSSDSNNNVDLRIDIDLDPFACTSKATECDGEPPLGGGEDCSASSSSLEEEEGERERVMRHLLEASDDELGLPSVENGVEERVLNGGEVLNFGDNLWELEDEAANYYTLLQSELFM